MEIGDIGTVERDGNKIGHREQIHVLLCHLFLHEKRMVPTYMWNAGNKPTSRTL